MTLRGWAIFVLVVVLSYYLVKNVILALSARYLRRIGLRVRSIGLVAGVRGLCFEPALVMQRHVNTRKPPVSLQRVYIETMHVRIHLPSRSHPSLLTASIDGVRASFSVGPSTADAHDMASRTAAGEEKSESAIKPKRIKRKMQRILNGVASYLRNGFFRFVLGMVDVRVSDIEIVLKDEFSIDELIRYRQGFLHLAMSSSRQELSTRRSSEEDEDEEDDEILLNNAGKNLSLVLNVSPMQICGRGVGDEDHVQILCMDSVSTLTLSVSSSLIHFARLSDPEILLEAPGSTLFVTPLLHVLERIKHSLPRPRSMTSERYASLSSKFVPELKAKIDAVSLAMIHIRPVIRVKVKNISVRTLASGVAHRQENTHSAIPSMICSVQEATLSASTTSIKQVTGSKSNVMSISAALVIKNVTCDAIMSNQAVSFSGRFFELAEASARVHCNLGSKDSIFAEPDTPVSFTMSLVSPKVILNEALLKSFLLYQAAKNTDSQLPATKSATRSPEWTINVAREFLKAFAPTLQLQLFSPLLALRFSSYSSASSVPFSSGSRDSENFQSKNLPVFVDAVIAFTFSEFILNGAFLHENADVLSGQLALSVRSIKILGLTVKEAATIELYTNDTRDQLVRLENVDADAKLKIPIVTGESSVVETSLHGNVKISPLIVDLSPLGNSRNLNYFGFALVINSVFSVDQNSYINDPVASVSERTRLTENAEDSALMIPAFKIFVTLNCDQFALIASDSSKAGIVFDLNSISSEVDGTVLVRSRSLDNEAEVLQFTQRSSSRLFLAAKGDIDEIQVRTLDILEVLDDHTHGGEVLISIKRCSVSASHSPMFAPKVTLCDAALFFNFRKYYIALTSAVPLIKIAKVFEVRRGLNVRRPHHSHIDLVVATLDKFSVKADLPNGTQLRGLALLCKAQIRDGGSSLLSVKTVNLETVTGPHTWEDLAVISNISVHVFKAPDKYPDYVWNIDIAAKDLSLINPSDLQLSLVFEDVINTSKAAKNIAFEKLGLVSSSELYKSGRTKMVCETTPVIAVKVERVCLKLLNSTFEDSLSRNYVRGLQEQLCRIQRYRLFQKHAAKYRWRMETDPDRLRHFDLEKAWWQLQEFNSRIWIQKIQKAKSESQATPLLYAEVHNIVVCLSAPSLPASTIEESLHKIDPTTPDNLIYEELIPRDISLSLTGISVHLRDYPLPLVMLQDCGVPCLKGTGLLILADQVSSDQSKRFVSLDLAPLSAPPVLASRTINPIKVYLQTQTLITTSDTIFASWGAALEPCLADMTRILDAFTLPSLDPSPPVGWWDKVRIILHGENSVTVSNNATLRVRVLGSTTPFYDARFDHGCEGIDIVLRDGVNIDFKEDVTIKCGDLAFSIPSSPHEIGKVQGSRRVDIMEDVIAKFKSGVKVSFGIRFMTILRDEEGIETEQVATKPHSEVILKHPDYVRRDSYGQLIDSYEGYRTSTIRITVNIECPSPDSELASDNLAIAGFVCVNSDSLRKFLALIPIYQSPLTTIPIHRGELFYGAGVPLTKPKLGRCIGSVRLKLTVHPLVLSYLTELIDASGGIGIRLRAHRMDVNMLFKQSSPRKIGGKTTRWSLDTSLIELGGVEGRVFSFFSEGVMKQYEADSEASLLVSRSGVDDKEGWILDSDYEYVEDPEESIYLLPFVWAPRIVYFKRSDDGSVADRDQTEVDIGMCVSRSQAELFQARLSELETAIGHYLELQRSLEYRMAIFFDDSIRQQSDNISEKLRVLHEKKNIIERQRKLWHHKTDRQLKWDSSQLDVSRTAIFDHHYIIHNCNLLYNKDLRNCVFKFLDLIERDYSLKYCLSNAALKSAKELVVSVANRVNQRATASQAKKNFRQGTHHESVQFDASMAQELLENLLSDLDNFVVRNESEVNSTLSQGAEPLNAQSKPNSTFVKVDASSRPLSDFNYYISSEDPSSPDFVPPSQHVESNFIIKLINPQINFECHAKDDEQDLNCVIVAAENMHWQSVSIVDGSVQESIASGLHHDEEADQMNAAERILKRRTVVSISNAQFYAARILDIENASDHDIDHIVMPVISREDGIVITSTMGVWPVWVPLECIFDPTSHMGYLQRLVKQTSASFHRDKPNPLYVERQRTAGASSPSQGSEKPIDSIHINFPKFRISMDATQYVIFSDIVLRLLVYKDPARGERNTKLRNVILALEQVDDLRKFMDTVISLQDRIRLLETELRFGDGKKALSVRKRLIFYQDELYIIMNALKGMYAMEKRRKSDNVGLRVQFFARDLEWFMLLDSRDRLGKLTFTNTRLDWIQYEDQSNTNTLEIDKLTILNLLPNQAFKSLLAPFVPDNMARVDFSRSKMLRLYWRELAPVAGIPVVDHFEVNIHPLLLQVTREIGRQLEYYFFPERKKKVQAKAALSSGGAAVGVDEIQKPSASVRAEDAKSVISGAGGSLQQPAAPEPPPSKYRRTASAGKKDVMLLNKRLDDLSQMQRRAASNKSYIYIKFPRVELCLSYRGPKEKNIEDLNQFTFLMPTFEYRNKTWSWSDMFAAVKKDAIRAVLANSGALVREKLFQNRKRGLGPVGQYLDDSANTSSNSLLYIEDASQSPTSRLEVDDGEHIPLRHARSHDHVRSVSAGATFGEGSTSGFEKKAMALFKGWHRKKRTADSAGDGDDK